MEDSQESTYSLAKYDPNDESSLSQYMSLTECERDIQLLEREIRKQKESSAHAKTAITFDQLRKIHTMSTLLGPHKEVFYDRICRAADIQRASLKNRLKSNINKFEPSTPLSFNQFENNSQSSLTAGDSQNFVVTPTTLNNLFSGNNPRKPLGSEMLAPMSSEEDLMKFPAERQFELMQIGFSYDEVKQLLEMFEKFKNDMQEINRPSLTQLLNQFSNYISMCSPVNLKLISQAFNLLELGSSASEVKRVLLKARRRAESEESEISAPFPKKSREDQRSPNRDDLILGLDRSPQSDDGTQKI